ncbi:hypothetical protein A1O1_08099 [Capronia coronata CBS 617.96]|uniref:DUF1783-domain-containing protein n=1 Tax=Capronia coronata CBS 617.96 TaxID=1182541 RepID=W9XYJ4_9EURO|nr:uncharacterized protein A1O1_08099 [Capronia coronata CBS 617.96]EXJ82031.1 hypothetical protein A1O1_08099 [Capronia coronata CBS 617.96]
MNRSTRTSIFRIPASTPTSMPRCTTTRPCTRTPLSPSHSSARYSTRTARLSKPLPTTFSKRNTSTSTSPINSSSSPNSQIIHPLVPPPKAGSGPLLSRRPDRALPDLPRRGAWTTTLPLFALLIGVASLAIFNYQKSSSSTVNAILYALRTNEQARELLGDEIYFASRIPWIRGELAPMQGTIDISFWVKGKKDQALVKFVSIRKRSDAFFETLEWSLKTRDGKVLHLLDSSNDPMAGAKI